MIDPEEQYRSIVASLAGKSAYKVEVLKQTKKQFAALKLEAEQLATTLCKEVDCIEGVSVSYSSKGAFQAELKFGEDILVFFLHNDVFDFDKSHSIWKRSYVEKDRMHAFCGMISIFNFLSSSIEMGRSEDIGYMIGRIFINHDAHYFVEGKKQLGFLFNDFGTAVLDPEAIRSILMTAISYCQEFDLLVPPFRATSEIQVSRMMDISNRMNMQTGKRLGFQFSWDADSPE